MAKAKKKAPSPVKKLRTTVKEVNKLGAYAKPRYQTIVIGLLILGGALTLAWAGWKVLEYLF